MTSVWSRAVRDTAARKRQPRIRIGLFIGLLSIWTGPIAEINEIRAFRSGITLMSRRRLRGALYDDANRLETETNFDGNRRVFGGDRAASVLCAGSVRSGAIREVRSRVHRVYHVPLQGGAGAV